MPANSPNTPEKLADYPELAARIKKYQQLTTLN